MEAEQLILPNLIMFNILEKTSVAVYRIAASRLECGSGNRL